MIAPDHAFAERIRSLVPINGLDARLQEQALAQGELLEFRKKKTVFEMGARDPWTFYLLDGELELQAAESSPVRMNAGDENARRALAQLQPRRYTAVALSPVSVFRIERAVLDHILADEQMLEEAGADMDVRELEEDEDDGADWMSRLLSSELFTRLPHENIQRFFTELEPLDAPKDEVVVEQGTPGDYLYIVAEGRCQVVRRAPGGGQETVLATLKEGDSFGEESLISNSPRNASIRMASDGMLMRLPKAAFEELVSNPTLKAVPWSEASALVESGAIWVDVRFADEHKADGIEGSINAPLNSLRQQAANLDRDARYIVYCDSGARSSAGAFLMARLGFDTCYLAGGLDRSPHAAAKTAPSPTTEVDEADAGISTEVSELAAAAGAAFDFEFVSADETQEADTDADEAPAPDMAGETLAGDPQPVPDAVEAPPAPATAAAVNEAAQPHTTTQHPQMAKARAALATLKAERDKAVAYGKKAADAARELKRRNEELNVRLQAENDRRVQLDKELTAARADAERQAAMEQSRLSGDLDKALKRITALTTERDQAQEKMAADRSELQARIDDAQARLAAILKDKEQADALHVAAEVAFQDSLQAAQGDAKAANTRAQEFEQELSQARERIAELESRDQDDAQQQLAETSEIKMDLAVAQGKLDEEREQLDQERKQLNEELTTLRKEREDAEQNLSAERARLEKDIAAAQSRNELLDQRELELNDARDAVDQTLQQRDQTLAERESKLAELEQSLSDEKAAWQQTVDKAIADERARLEAEHTRFREESDAQYEQRVQSTVAEKVEELHDEHQAREAQMRAQVEAHVAKLLAEFDARLETVRSGYETRLSEQEAMLEDERRRLETEIVRLREALTDARQTPTSASAPVLAGERPLPEPQAQDAPALDFELNESAAAAIKSEEPSEEPLHVAVEAPVAEPATPGIGTDLELDLEIDESDLRDNTKATEHAQPPAASDIPQIEMPESDEPEETSPDKANEKRDRVISTDQLAEIRRRMQEKMRAAKARTG